MTDEKIAQALKDAAVTDTITCPQAFTIAEKANVSRADVGKYCTANHIKIRGCQLGCFK
ncbi:MAG: hypothetical protein GX651_03890 [Methanomicrobiales archaeon]|nr:hypothetical protein [Methanomicrobiales archaeon]